MITPTESRRWKVVNLLSRLPRTCIAELVGWAQEDDAKAQFPPGPAFARRGAGAPTPSKEKAMEYLTSLSGSLDIVPPLKYAEFKDSPYRMFSDEGCWILRLEIEEDEEETDAGTMIVKTATSLVAWEDSVKAYDIESDLQAIVSAFPGHEFTGCIEGDGEENGDMWRLYVRGGRVIKLVPEMVWPATP